MVNDVLPETDLAVGAEFEFEAVEPGVVKDITDCGVRDTVPSVEANNVLSAKFNRTAPQEAQTDTNGDKCKEQKDNKNTPRKNQCPKV